MKTEPLKDKHNFKNEHICIWWRGPLQGEDDHLFNLDEDEHDAFDDKRVSVTYEVTFAPNKSKQVHRLSYFNYASKYCKSYY